MRARDIMHRDAVALTPNEDIARAADYMRFEPDACLPVVTDQKRRILIGVITARDIVARCVAREHACHCLVSDHMTPLPLHTVSPDDTIQDAAVKLAEGDIRRIPVTTADGALLGMVTESDVRRALDGFGLIGHHALAIPAAG